MAVERYANRAVSTLTGTITSGATSLAVTSATLFPTSGNFMVLLEDELVAVTAVSGTTFTIVRAREGTTAASHASGTAITQIVTAASIVRTIPFLQLTPPPAVANWTFVNQGAATATDLDAGLFLEIPAGVGDQLRGLVRALPSATNYTITSLFAPFWSGEAFARIGMAIYDGTKIIANWWDSASSLTNMFFTVQKWNSVTSFNGNATTNQNLYSNNAQVWRDDFATWWRIRDDGTTVHFEVSKDYMRWWKVGEIGNTAFLTATHAGIFLDGFNSSIKNGMSLLSWTEE